MTRSRFSDNRGSSSRDPGPSSRTATVRRSFFRRALASLLDRVVPSEAVELDGLDGARVELDRARVRGELSVEPEEHYRHEHYRGLPPVPGVIVDEVHVWRGLSGFAELAGEELVSDEDVPEVELTPEQRARFEHAAGRGLAARRAELAGEGLVDDELDPYPRPPFVEGVFVGHDHASTVWPGPEGRPEDGRRLILRALARDGFAPVVLGDGSCLRCGALRFDRSGWPVPAGLVFEGFAPGRPMCEGCALRTAVGFGDDVWLADELLVEPAPVEGKLRIRPTEIVVVPAGEVAARIEEGRR